MIAFGRRGARGPRYGYWRYGSIQILRDGRVRFSPRAFPGLPWLSFLKSQNVDAEIWGRVVLYLRLERGRVVSASFVPDLTPAELRDAVYALETARHGLERWIIPALEQTQARLSGEDWGQELFKAIPEILDSVRRGLPRGSRARR